MRAVPLMALALLAQAVSAMDSRDTRGLAVAIERLADPLIVDGLAMHVERAQGPDVGDLARRIEERWRLDRSIVLASPHKDWHIRSRWAGSRSEVIQWRGAGDGGELLYSWFDASGRPRSPVAEPVSLPPQCRWTRRVEGRSPPERYVQLTARCRIGVAGLVSRLESLLVRHDWTVLHRGSMAWYVMRTPETARATVVGGASPGESALVWVTTTRDYRP